MRPAVWIMALIAAPAAVPAAGGGEPDIGERQAVKIASAGEPGAETGRLSVRASLHQTPWNDCIPRESTSQYLRDRMQRLAGRTYWAVYFAPAGGKGVKGGDFCRFVDARTGEIITEVRWK